MKYLLHQYNPHSQTQVYNPPSNTSCPAIFESSKVNRVRCISFWKLLLPSFENPNTFIEFTSHHRPPLSLPLLDSKGVELNLVSSVLGTFVGKFQSPTTSSVFSSNKKYFIKGNAVILDGHDMLPQKLLQIKITPLEKKSHQLISVILNNTIK